MRLAILLILSCTIVLLSGCRSPEERASVYLDKAQALFDEADYANAKLEALNAAQIEPKNAGVRYLLAIIAEQDGNGREMFQHLLVAVAEDPTMVAARVKLGVLYVFAQAHELAWEQADAALKLAPDDPEVRVLIARLRSRQGESELAMAALDEVLSRNPDNLEALGMKALAMHESEPDQALDLLDAAIGRLAVDESQSLRRLKLDILSYHGRTQSVEQTLQAMIAASPDDDSTYQAELARFYRTQGRMDDAEDMLRDLAAVASGDINAKLDVVRFLAEVRDPAVAGEALQAFVEEDPENQRLKVVLADYFLNNGRREAAISVYEEVAAFDPLSESGLLARVKLAAEDVRSDEIDRAREAVSAILVDEPAYPRALLLRAGLLYVDQRYDEAVADLRVVVRKEATNQAALLMLARTDVAAGNVILGKESYRRLLQVNPNHSAATQELIALALRANDFDEAETLLERMTAAGPGNIDAGVLMVELRVRQEDWQAAEAEARRMAAGADPNGVGVFQLGLVLEGQQRYQEAGEAFSQALEKNPDNTRMLQGFARSLNARGKEQDTIAYLRQRVTENPDELGIRLMLGGALADAGQNAAALQMWESVITDDPKLSPAYVAVASLYPDDAAKRIASYRRGLDASPANLPLAAYLAGEYQRLERYDDLIALYEASLAENPQNVSIANNLAAVLADYRYQDPASLQRAVQLANLLADTDDPYIMDTVGWVYHRGEDTDRAVRYLERAVAAVGGIPVMHYHLGMAYFVAGDRVGAKQELEKATQFADANFAGIEEARETLAKL